MDKSKWSWLPEFMPGVQRLIQERKVRHGAAHVAECWHRGVVLREPGWFFAREGALAVGTPAQDEALAAFGAAQVTATQALLLMREPGHGA